LPPARVLQVGLEREVLVRRDGDVEAEPAERVAVVAPVGKARILEALHALAELAAHAQPLGQTLVGAVEHRDPRRRWRWRGRGRRRLLGRSRQREHEQRDRHQPAGADEQ